MLLWHLWFLYCTMRGWSGCKLFTKKIKLFVKWTPERQGINEAWATRHKWGQPASDMSRNWNNKQWISGNIYIIIYVINVFQRSKRWSISIIPNISPLLEDWFMQNIALLIEYKVKVTRKKNSVTLKVQTSRQITSFGHSYSKHQIYTK